MLWLWASLSGQLGPHNSQETDVPLFHLRELQYIFDHFEEKLGGEAQSKEKADVILQAFPG